MRKPANADAWNRFADGGRALLVGAAVVAPLWRKDFRTSFDGLTSVIATYAACKAIKAFLARTASGWRERPQLPVGTCGRLLCRGGDPGP